MKQTTLISCTVVSGLLMLARPAAAQPAPSVTSNIFYLPVAVHTPGLFNSFFKSHVAFYNATGAPFSVQATLFDSHGAAHVATFTLAANEVIAYADFVDEVFHLTGAGTVKFDSGAAANQMALSAEVYTNGPCGDFGTDVPAIAATLSAAESISPGVTNNTAQRTNLACFNGSASTNHVVADVWSESNTKVQTITFDLPGNAWQQLPVTVTTQGGYVRFHPSAPAFCYAVVVTDLSNDGRFIPGQALSQ